MRGSFSSPAALQAQQCAGGGMLEASSGPEVRAASPPPIGMDYWFCSNKGVCCLAQHSLVMMTWCFFSDPSVVCFLMLPMVACGCAAAKVTQGLRARHAATLNPFSRWALPNLNSQHEGVQNSSGQRRCVRVRCSPAQNWGAVPGTRVQTALTSLCSTPGTGRGEENTQGSLDPL